MDWGALGKRPSMGRRACGGREEVEGGEGAVNRRSKLVRSLCRPRVDRAEAKPGSEWIGEVVEHSGFEPLTSSMPLKRSTN